jgi:DNA mismatch repair protein MutS2
MADIESKIGYDRIRSQVVAHCTTEGGSAKFAAETFSTDSAVIGERLRLSDQMRAAMMMESGFPGGEYIDLNPLLRKAEIEGAFLEVQDMASLRAALSSVADLLKFFRDKDATKYPDLIALTSGVSGFDNIVYRIDEIIDRFGNIKDNASPELLSLRRTIREREGLASKRLQQILAKAQSAGVVDGDAAVSIRDGRAVIPVSAANKRKLQGFIHDESATGKTVYIEPVEVVEINNELRELEYAERREIVRILTVFTDEIRPDIGEIDRSGDYLTTIDMIRAKARFAIDNRCVMPIISDDWTLELRQARHPLLEQALRRENKPIVPLDIKLTRAKHILLISGPNAGGKSVCLKTVGLLQWMFQCGMPVPALENSQMPVFDRLFIDIGDEQSIDNDLSTYSSHLLNMKQMLQQATERSLVLIDEFGTGTEPVIGGAIAEAILERLEHKGCFGVITTHYSNLKYYASNAAGVVNGGMAFDVQNIQPLFKLEIGIPGSSFAVEIARKIGLPEDIIRSASEKAGSGHINIEKQLREIARDRRYWEQKRDRIRITDRKVEELEQKYTEQLATIKQQRTEIIKSAKSEAERITAEANRQIENVIREIRQSQADKDIVRLARKDMDDFRSSLDSDTAISPEEQAKIDREMERLAQRQQRRAERKAKRGEAVAEHEASPEPVVLKPEVGSKVKIEGQATIGEVQSIKGKKATVAFGQLLTTVPVDKLTVVSNSEYKKQQRSSKVSTINVSADVAERRLNFKHSINVRGMRVAEALEMVEDFLDDAIMVGASQVSILHGKGTGALKDEIRRYLRTIPQVASAEDEHVERGGAGITVVTLT